MGLILGLCAGVGLVLVWQAVAAPVRFELPARRQSRRQSRRAAIDTALWPDVVDDMASAIKAGLSLPQAVGQLAVQGPEALRSLFAGAHRRYLETGDFAAAMVGLRQVACDPVADKFCAALVMAYQVGGSDLAGVLRTLSEVLRDDIRIRGEIAARQSWTVNGARLAVGAPWVTVLLLSTRGDAARVYSSPGGLRMLATCAVVSVLAYAVMLRVGRLPQDQVMPA